MDFRDFIMEFELRGVKDLKVSPIIPSPEVSLRVRNSGATKMRLWQPSKPYKPIFRANKSELKKTS